MTIAFDMAQPDESSMKEGGSAATPPLESANCEASRESAVQLGPRTRGTDLLDLLAPGKRGRTGVGNGGIVPPVAYRWRKGRSGNPAGRPKRKPLYDSLLELVNSQLTDEAKKRLRIAFDLGSNATVAEYLAATLINLALQGDVAALREIRENTDGRTLEIVVPDQPMVDPKEAYTRKLHEDLGRLLVSRTAAFPSHASPLPQVQEMLAAERKAHVGEKTEE